jgi:hypothetical protein
MKEKDKTATVASETDVDEIYLRIWEKQQEWTSTRWNITTFFLSISFALFGLSLQGSPGPLEGNIQRLAGLSIYWFAFLLFRRYDDWSKFLRAYLEELETTSSTRLKLHTRWKKSKSGLRKWTSISKLLIYFGMIYTVAVVLLWMIRLEENLPNTACS